MRVIALILLWLGVTGFGLVTLCAGTVGMSVPWVGLPIGLVAGALTWLCWKTIGRLKRPPLDLTPPYAPLPEADEQPPRHASSPLDQPTQAGPTD